MTCHVMCDMTSSVVRQLRYWQSSVNQVTVETWQSDTTLFFRKSETWAFLSKGRWAAHSDVYMFELSDRHNLVWAGSLSSSVRVSCGSPDSQLHQSYHASSSCLLHVFCADGKHGSVCCMSHKPCLFVSLSCKFSNHYYLSSNICKIFILIYCSILIYWLSPLNICCCESQNLLSRIMFYRSVSVLWRSYLHALNQTVHQEGVQRKRLMEDLKQKVFLDFLLAISLRAHIFTHTNTHTPPLAQMTEQCYRKLCDS